MKNKRIMFITIIIITGIITLFCMITFAHAYTGSGIDENEMEYYCPPYTETINNGEYVTFTLGNQSCYYTLKDGPSGTAYYGDIYKGTIGNSDKIGGHSLGSDCNDGNCIKMETDDWSNGSSVSYTTGDDIIIAIYEYGDGSCREYIQNGTGACNDGNYGIYQLKWGNSLTNNSLTFTKPTGIYAETINVGLPIEFEYTISSSNDCWTGIEVDFYTVATSSGTMLLSDRNTKRYEISNRPNGDCIEGPITSTWISANSGYISGYKIGQGHNETMPDEGYYLYRPKFYRDENTTQTASTSQYYLPVGEWGYYFTVGDTEYYGQPIASSSFDETITSSGYDADYEEVFEDFEENNIPNELRNRFPFVYFYQIKDIITTTGLFWETTSSSEGFASMSLIIPSVSGSYGTITSQAWTIAILDQDTILSIMPQETWNTIKSFITTALYIGLFFIMWNKIKGFWNSN